MTSPWYSELAKPNWSHLPRSLTWLTLTLLKLAMKLRELKHEGRLNIMHYSLSSLFPTVRWSCLDKDNLFAIMASFLHMSLPPFRRHEADLTNEKAQRPDDETKPKLGCGRESLN